MPTDPIRYAGDPGIRSRPLVAAALMISLLSHRAAAEDLAWLPLTAFDAEVRAAIETGATTQHLGVFAFTDPADVQLAFAELDEQPGDAPFAERSEIILRRDPAICPPNDCPVMILTWRGTGYEELDTLKRPGIALSAPLAAQPV